MDMSWIRKIINWLLRRPAQPVVKVVMPEKIAGQAIAEAMTVAMGGRTAAQLKRGAPAGVPQRVSFTNEGEPVVADAADGVHIPIADVVIDQRNNPMVINADLIMLHGREKPDPSFAPLYKRLFGKEPKGAHTTRSFF